MSNVWDRFDSIARPEEVAEAKLQFAPLEAGDYGMVLEGIEPAESQSGLPMIKGQFRLVDGGKVVYYNQMLQNLNYPNMTPVNIAEGVSFISGLIGEDIEYKGLGDFADIISGIQTGEVYTINVSYGKKDVDKKYPKLKFVSREMPF